MIKMDINYSKMCQWEIEKAVYLQKTAIDLGMKLDGGGEVSVNSGSGYTYIYLEDYSFTLYMPINCDLIKTDVYALWANPEDGEEIEMALKKKTTLVDLEKWVAKLVGEEYK